MRSKRLHLHSVRSPGFTVVELMIALAVLAILVAVAIPSFREISMNNRSTGYVNGLIGDLSMARSEALKLAQTVSVAAVGGDWSEGWVVFVDDDGDGVVGGTDVVLKEANKLNPHATEYNSFILTAVAGLAVGGDQIESITFGSLGQTVDPNDGARFALCRPDRDASRSSGIRIDLTGRAHSVKGLAAIGLGCS